MTADELADLPAKVTCLLGAAASLNSVTCALNYFGFFYAALETALLTCYTVCFFFYRVDFVVNESFDWASPSAPTVFAVETL